MGIREKIEKLTELRKVEPLEAPADLDLTDPAQVRAWLEQKAKG